MKHSSRASQNIELFLGVTCFTLAFIQYESECQNKTILLTPEPGIPKQGRWIYDYDTYESEVEIKPHDGVHLIFD